MSKGTFLIVEDQYVVAENLRTEVEAMGYEVAGLASSGKEALRLARLKKPDLVLMDIKLRGEMDGIDTAMVLRRELDVASFFLTAFSGDDLLHRAREAEPLGFLVKPFERSGLRAGLEMALYRVKMERLLKESESRFRSMFENSPVAYLALDENGCCVNGNSELCALLGYGYGEIIGRQFADFFPVGQGQETSGQFINIKDSDRIEYELEVVGKDAARLTVVLQGRVQSSLTGKSEVMHCILHDITERKGFEEVRQRTAETLKNVNDVLEQRVLERTIELEKSNATLSMMLNYAQKAEKDIQERVVANLRTDILFLLDSLKREKLSENGYKLVEMLESTTHNLAHPLARSLESNLLKLTPREIQIANLIKHGKTTKEIMALLDLSPKTIETHRNSLRDKLGLRNTKTNLRTFLKSEMIR